MKINLILRLVVLVIGVERQKLGEVTIRVLETIKLQARATELFLDV
jgi:hypothetical protein